VATDVITQIHLESRGTYGAPRVHAELTMGRGIAVGHNAVAMLMHRAGLQGLPGARRDRSSQTPTVGDLVERSFARTQPNQLWVTDITEHPTRARNPGNIKGLHRTQSGSQHLIGKLVLEQAEGASGVCLALEDVNARRVPKLGGRSVACLDENDAIEAAQDLDRRVLRDAVRRVADGEDEPLLVKEGLHVL